MIPHFRRDDIAMITIHDTETAKQILVAAFNVMNPGTPTTVELCDSIPGNEGYEVVAKILSAHFYVAMEQSRSLGEDIASVPLEFFQGSERARTAVMKTLGDSMRSDKLEEAQVIAACAKLKVPYDNDQALIMVQ